MKTEIQEALEKNQPLFLSDLSRFAGCHQNAAFAWVKKPDFPKSCGKRKGKNHWLNPVYPAKECIAWLILHHKISPIDGFEHGDYIFEPDTCESESERFPAIDNSLARQFITGAFYCFNAFSGKKIQQTQTLHIRTEGVWPCLK